MLKGRSFSAVANRAGEIGVASLDIMFGILYANFLGLVVLLWKLWEWNEELEGYRRHRKTRLGAQLTLCEVRAQISLGDLWTTI